MALCQRNYFIISSQVWVHFVIYFLIEQFSTWIHSSTIRFRYFSKNQHIEHPRSTCIVLAIISLQQRDDFCSGMATEMIFAGSSLERVAPHWTPFGPGLHPVPLHLANAAKCVTRTSLSSRSARGDLVHSASHNFIRPDHGSPGTLWQMYPSANFKLVPAVYGVIRRGGPQSSRRRLRTKPYCTRNITNNVNCLLNGYLFAPVCGSVDRNS